VAIVKANYTRSRGKAKAILRYITHRPGREGERITRVLFGHDGERSKQAAYQMMDAQKGMTYFHIKLNFHPKREDTRRDLDLRSITKQTIRALEERLQRRIGFIAAEHTDHSPLRHIHAIAIIKLRRGERLTREDFKAMRDIATEKALLQRKARDLVKQYLHNREFLKRTRTPLSLSSRSMGVSGGRARTIKTARTPTPPCPTSGMGHTTVKLPNGNYWCRECERVRERSVELSI
jgi:hypothetical protein